MQVVTSSLRWKPFFIINKYQGYSNSQVDENPKLHTEQKELYQIPGRTHACFYFSSIKTVLAIINHPEYVSSSQS